MKTVLLGDVCGFKRGLTYKKTDEVEVSSNVVLRANNINPVTLSLDLSELRYIRDNIEIPASKKLKKNALLICTASGSKSHLGKVAFIDKEYDYAFGGFMGLLIPDENLIDPKYLYRILTSYNFRRHLDELTDGANINNLKFSLIEDYEIFLPPIEEQGRVVKKLDEAFEKIDKAIELTQKNLQNSQELFESNLNKIFFGDQSWVKLALRDALDKSFNINWRDTGNSEFTYIDLTAVDRNSSQIHTTNRINKLNAPSRAKQIVLKDDVIFGTTRPTLKRIGLIDEEFDGQICSTGFCVLRADKSTLNSKLIYYFLKTEKFMDYMEKLQRGTSYPAVTDNDVKTQIIHFPVKLNEQKKVANELDGLSAQTQKLQKLYQQKLDNLQELKKSLLDKAFKGEL